MKTIKYLLALAILCIAAFGQNQNNQNPKSLCTTTVANLSIACGTTKGTLATITDGTSTSDCTTGGASSVATCTYNGAAWTSVGGAGGSPALSSVTASLGNTSIANGNNTETWTAAQTTDAQDAFGLNEASAATNGTLTNGLANQAEFEVSTASNSTATPSEVVQGAITNTVATPAFQLETTWNNASLVGEGILFNTTNTASSAASKLFDLRVGNSTVFGVQPTGSFAMGGATVTTPGTGNFLFGVDGTQPASISAGASGWTMDSTANCPVQWNNAANVGCSAAYGAANAFTAANTFTSAGTFNIDSVVNSPVTANVNSFPFLTQYQYAQGSHGAQFALMGGVSNPAASGTPVENAAGIAGFALNNSAGGIGVGTSAIGGYFQSVCNVNSSHCWGEVSAAIDVTGLTTGVQLIGEEMDIDPQNASGVYANIIGKNLVLNPHSAGSYGTATLCQASSGSTWAACIGSSAATAAVFASIGATCTSGTCNSQPINFNSFNAGVSTTAAINSDGAGDLVMSPAAGAFETMSNPLAILPTSNQISFTGLAHTVTFNVTAPAAGRNYTFPDPGASSNVLMTNTNADGNVATLINCALTSASTCLTEGETTAATTAGAVEDQITTLSTSTAIPLQITQGAAGPAAANAPAIINVSAASAGGAAGASQNGFTGAPIALITGAGSAGGATSGNGGTGGAFTVALGAGGAAGGNTVNGGGAGGSTTITPGAGTAAAATGAGGAAGTTTFAAASGGTGGATSGTGGAGSDFLVTSGNGGNATAGSTTGRGGNITFTLGQTGNGTGTSGAPGQFSITGPTLKGTLTTATVNVTGTWNTTGVVDAGIFENITNTASGSGSSLMDLQASATSQLSVKSQAANSFALGPNIALGGTAPAITTPGTTPYLNMNTLMKGAKNACTFALTTGTFTTAASPVTICTFTLPATALSWYWTCSGTWSNPAGTTPTMSLGENFAQAPSAASAMANIWTTNTGTSTQGSNLTAASGATNILTTGTLTNSATLFQETWSGTFTGSATSGNFTLTTSLTGTGATGTLNGGCIIE